MNVAVIHGPNLNLLGRREKKIYGRFTLSALDQKLVALGRELKLEVISFQSNSEGEIIDIIQSLETGLVGKKTEAKSSISRRVQRFMAINLPIFIRQPRAGLSESPERWPGYLLPLCR